MQPRRSTPYYWNQYQVGRPTEFRNFFLGRTYIQMFIISNGAHQIFSGDGSDWFGIRPAISLGIRGEDLFGLVNILN